MLYLKALNSKLYFRHSEVWPQEGHLSRQSSLEVWSHGGHLIRRYLLYVAATTLRLLLQNSNFWIVQSLYFFVRTQVPSQELGNLTRPGCRLLVVYTFRLKLHFCRWSHGGWRSTTGGATALLPSLSCPWGHGRYTPYSIGVLLCFCLLRITQRHDE